MASNDCNINGIFTCDKFSVGGIRKVWIIPFSDLYDLTYVGDELGKVDSFKCLTLPVEYEVVDGAFEEQLLSAPYNSYQHSLAISVAKLDYQKRNEFSKLAGKYVAAIFKDKNGLCWIAGFDRPLKVGRFKAETGGTASIYNLEMNGNSRYQVKEIECFNSDCFASFNGSLLNVSTFVIESASTYNFGADWEVIDQSGLLSYTPNQPLDPTDWTTPATYAQDVAELSNLVGDPSTSIVLSYNLGLDEATITLYSPTTTYDFLTFAGQTSIESSISTTLNLYFTLGPLVALPTTVITVTDSDLNVVYTGNVGDALVGAGLSGTVDNAFIVVSDLYPGGTTFIAEVDGIGCPTEEYTFVLDPLADCSVTTEVAYNYGHTYTISIPNNSSFGKRWQKVVMFYDEWQFDIIADASEATDDYPTFQAAVISALSSDPNCPIDPSSITFSINFVNTTINFASTRRDSDLIVHSSRAFGTNDYSFMTATYGKQSNLMQISTSAAPSSYIAIVNDATADVLAGTTGSAPSINDGYQLDSFDDLGNPTVMENIAFNINGYVEDEAWTLKVQSSTCPDTTQAIDTAVCFDTAPLTITRRYDKFVLNVAANATPELSEAWVFSYDIGATTYTYVVTTTNEQFCNRYTDELSVAIRNTFPLYAGDNPVKVLNFSYDPFIGDFTLELDCSIDVVWNMIEADYEDVAQAFVLVESFDITNCEFDPIINPHTQVDWSFNDVDAVAVVQSGEALSALFRSRNNAPLDIASFNFNSGTVEMKVTLLVGSNPGAIYFEFWDSSFNLLETIGVFAPNLSENVPFVSTPTDVAYVSMQDSFGSFDWIAWDSTTQSDVDVFITRNKLERNIWGRLDRWNALTPLVFTPSPVIVSLLCP